MPGDSIYEIHVDPIRVLNGKLGSTKSMLTFVLCESQSKFQAASCCCYTVVYICFFVTDNSIILTVHIFFCFIYIAALWGTKLDLLFDQCFEFLQSCSSYICLLKGFSKEAMLGVSCLLRSLFYHPIDPIYNPVTYTNCSLCNDKLTLWMNCSINCLWFSCVELMSWTI